MPCSPSVPEAQADGQRESRTYTTTASAGVSSAPVHIGEPGIFTLLINSGGYATPGQPLAGRSPARSAARPAASILGQRLTATGWQPRVGDQRAMRSAGTSGVNRFSLVVPRSEEWLADRPGGAARRCSFQDEVDSPDGDRQLHAGATSPATGPAPPTPITRSPARRFATAPARRSPGRSTSTVRRPGALRLVQQAFVQAGYYSGYHFTLSEVHHARAAPAPDDADVRDRPPRKGRTSWSSGCKVQRRDRPGKATWQANVAGVGGSILRQHLPAGKFRLGGGSLLLIQKPGGQDLPMDLRPLWLGARRFCTRSAA